MPGYCQEAWDWVQSLYDDPMSEGAPLDEIVGGYERRHAQKCDVCRERLILAGMP